MNISGKIRSMCEEAESELRETFSDIDRVSGVLTEHVLDCFRKHCVSESLFAPSTGYGYGDRGRDEADGIAADIFRAEAGFIRPSILSGTHAITVALFGILRPGDVMLSVTGRPYDTLLDVIGIGDGAPGEGSLRDWGVLYDSVDLLPDGSIDIAGLREKMESYGNRLKMVYVQRSRGYSSRPALSVKQITEAAYHTKVFAGENGLEKPVFTVDNCYGEFVEEYEPCCTVPNEDKSLGADIAIGSLIKNPGGGMADVGGYIVGREEYVKLCGNRLTCPGVGLDVGASLGQTRNILKGLFYAPHTVAQALKTAHLAAYIFESLGLGVSPGWREKRHDIVQTVCCGSAAALEAFCAGIQSGSPIDAHVTPVPWAMPGYPDEVIMAAGAFTGGSSIELSADGPMRAPYNAYMQGGLTYESARLAIMAAAEKVSNTI